MLVSLSMQDVRCLQLYWHRFRPSEISYTGDLYIAVNVQDKLAAQEVCSQEVFPLQLSVNM